jgi:hypothetical protein
MPDFLLIETQLGGGRAGTRFLRDAAALRGAGHRVRIYLVQDAVQAALPADRPGVAGLTGSGCAVWVDDFSLAQRGLTGADLSPGTVVASMDDVLPAVLDPAVRVVWH